MVFSHPTGNYVGQDRLGLDFALGENPWGCSPLVIRALRNAPSEALARYPDDFGKLLCRTLGQSLSIPPEWFCVGTGALGVLDLVFRSVSASQGKCVMPALTFPSYTILARQYHMEIVTCPMGLDLSIDISALSRSVRQKKPSLTILANPNNPTGRCMGRRDVDELVAATKDVGLLVLDEANIEYCPMSFTDWYRCDDWPQHVIVVRSFSKAHGLASLRIGYAIGQPDTIFALLKAWVDFPVTQLSLDAACVALSDIRHMSESVRRMEESRKMLTAGLEKIGLKGVPSDSNYLLVDLASRRIESPLLVKRLRALRVGVLDGANFPGLGSGYVRITPRTIEENHKLLAALEQCLKGPRH